MAWDYIQYIYPVPYNFEKFLLWSSVDFNCYFALREKEGDDWTYYAGNVSHELATGLKLTSYSTSEANAQTNYLTTTKDASNLVLALLPTLVFGKQVRLYIDDTQGAVQIYSFKPSTQLIANEILAGTLEITDRLAAAPSIKVTVSDQERILIGPLETDVYGIRGRDSSGNITFELKSNEDHPFIEYYADHRAIELELMKMNFQYISWAQFAVWDALDDETKRESPDPSTYDARVYKSRLDNGEDVTADREFGFVSKTYSDITTVDSGTSTSVGLNFLTDTAQSWFTDECKNLTLVDSGANEFNVDSNTLDTLTVVGTPASGAYTLKDDDPQYVVAFCSLQDHEIGGGAGSIKYEISFDGGANYQIFYDTINMPHVDLRSSTVVIADPGTSYIIRITLKNDGSGNGPYVYKFLACTDPSPWRW